MAEDNRKAEGMNLFLGSAEYIEREQDLAGIDEREQERVRIGKMTEEDSLREDEERSAYREALDRAYAVRREAADRAADQKDRERSAVRGIVRSEADEALSEISRRVRSTKSREDDALYKVLEKSASDAVYSGRSLCYDASDAAERDAKRVIEAAQRAGLIDEKTKKTEKERDYESKSI